MRVVNVEPVSVTVSWQTVEDADRYIVSFSQATGNNQQGLCSTSQTPSVTIMTSPASIDIGQTVDPTNENMLIAYTTYFISVVAVSETGFNSGDSDSVKHTTIQIGKR